MFAEKLNSLRTKKNKESELKVFKSSDGSFNFISEESLELRKKKKSWLMIKTNASSKTYWDLLIILLAIYNCFQIPFQIAFEPAFLEGKSVKMFNNVIDILFLLDILV